jgi:hypothetical protein
MRAVLGAFIAMGLGAGCSTGAGRQTGGGDDPTFAPTSTGQGTSTSMGNENETQGQIQTQTSSGEDGAEVTSVSTSSSTSGTAEPTASGTTTGDEAASVLITIDEGARPTTLVRIDPETGQGTPVCQLAPGSAYNTTTFSREDVLFAHNEGLARIERIDPCNCGFQIVGATDLPTLELTEGLSAADPKLIGIAPGTSAFVEINPNTGLANAIGPLGVLIVQPAIAWSDADATVYAIDGELDRLLTIDIATGLATDVAPLGTDLTTPGLEVLPSSGTLYACSGDDLYTIDGASGEVERIGAIGLTSPCNDLAAPRQAIACLE